MEVAKEEALKYAVTKEFATNEVENKLTIKRLTKEKNHLR